jgi:L-serine dehydratase
MIAPFNFTNASGVPLTVSTFDLFKPGIGPSSSHTVGPMLAAYRFVERLGSLDPVQRVTAELFGSLALTGVGHATDRAVLLGLSGALPDRIDPDTIGPEFARIRAEETLHLGGTHTVRFVFATDLDLGGASLPYHPNGMRFSAYAADGSLLDQRIYYSIGGGFVLDEDEAGRNAAPAGPEVPYPFCSAQELLAKADEAGLTIAQLQRANELATREPGELDAGLDGIWAAMQATIDRGLRSEERELPGGLKVRRRAARLAASLRERITADPLAALDWVNVWALAVTEENAAGGRVVTAPTMGAAGIIPAVISYYARLASGTPDGVRTFLLTAAAIGGLYKRNASISGAEVGCQGEVGVACSMAAGGLAAAFGGSNAQIENAAEIGMEHNLGLTCDPIKSLVQIPCIERNAVGAVKAIEAARLALSGDGTHHVTLDDVIRTMKRTGADMASAYKETSLGGLATNVTAC